MVDATESWKTSSWPYCKTQRIVGFVDVKLKPTSKILVSGVEFNWCSFFGGIQKKENKEKVHTKKENKEKVHIIILNRKNIQGEKIKRQKKHILLF